MYMLFLRRALAAAGVLLLAGAMISVDAQEQQRRGRPGGPGGQGGFGRGGFGFGGFGGGTDILRTATLPEVQNHLKITDDQKAYVGLLNETVQEQDQEFRASLQDIPREEIFTKFRERQETRNKEVETQLVDIIGKDKVARLKQIQVQEQGVAILFRDEYREQLSISEDQQEKIGDAMQEATEELQDLIRKKQEEKVRALLTSEQRAKWDELRGEPIDFKIERPRFGGPGGPGGGRFGRPGGGDGQGRPRRPGGNEG